MNFILKIFGNFINRVVVLTNKYYDGIVPQPNTFSEVDEQTLKELKAYPAVISSSIERYRFREALGELMNVARLGNKYLADEEPWKMVKTDPERVQTQMYVALQIASALRVLCEPFLPFTAGKLDVILNQAQHGKSWSDVSEQSELIEAGHRIGAAEILFSQIEDEQRQRDEAREMASQSERRANLLVGELEEIRSALDFVGVMRGCVQTTLPLFFIS